MIAHGIDIVNIKRIENLYYKYPSKFIKRIFTEKEIKNTHFYNLSNSRRIEKIAGRFATKEAAYKALELKSSVIVGFHDIIILDNKLGKPSLLFSEKVKKSIENDFKVSVSISHEKNYVIASVILYS